jgi:hypothetical protein
MPVVLDTAGAAASGLILGSTTSGSVPVPLNVNPNAPNLAALVGMLFTSGGDADITAATFAATFGGVTMSLAGHVEWNSNFDGIKLYSLAGPLTGTQDAVVAFTGMPTEALTRNLVVAAATYSGVGTIGSAVDGTTTSSANNTVTVSSVLPAHRVITLHGVSGANEFTSYNQQTRAHLHTAGLLGGDLLMGDAPGAATVTGTAIQALSSALWGAIGIPLTPAIVMGSAAINLAGLSMSPAGGVFRVVTPAPERTWVIPATPGVLPAGMSQPVPCFPNATPIAGNFVVSGDGIYMPLWSKDQFDILDYTLDWSNHIDASDPIVAATYQSSDTALGILSSNFNATYNTTTFWPTGGVLGVTYSVTCEIITNRGRRQKRDFAVTVVDN